MKYTPTEPSQRGGQTPSTTAAWPHACELGDEQGQPDADRSEKGAPVLLGRQHEDGEDELGREEHLDEETLSYARASGQPRPHREGPWEQRHDDSRRSYGGYDLGYEQQQASQRGRHSDDGQP